MPWKKVLSKNRIYPIILIIAVFIVWKYRQSQKPELISFMGKTMGPIIYNIKYLDNQNRDFKNEIDSLLDVFNNSLNHYRPNSEITRFNNDSLFYFDLPYFHEMLAKSKVVYEETNGAFDPTIGLLINAWGFGPDTNIQFPDSSEIDSLKRISNFNNIGFDDQKAWKLIQGVKLDFSAIAKGYGVDVVAGFLMEKGIKNYFVEIGGEIRCGGLNQDGNAWRVGIIDPRSDILQPSTYAVLGLKDMAMATSANNYNYIEKNGRKYVHTIDPFSGYPIEHNLLSASVFAEECSIADAYATAFMVLGLEDTKEILKSHPELQAYLIFTDVDGNLRKFVTPGIKDKILESL